MSAALREGLKFPERVSRHAGRWVPLYLEPLVGSGERVCIGVLATDGRSVEVAPAPQLDDLATLYGPGSKSIRWAAELALQETRHQFETRGIESIGASAPRIDGISFGGIREGAGKDLEDLAHVALMQVSSIAAMQEAAGHVDMPLSVRSPDHEGLARIIRSVRTTVGATHPDLRPYFARSFAPKQAARPLVFGFVGRHLAINFSLLNAKSAGELAGQVDRAKARVLDLESLRGGRFTDELPLPRRHLDYELFVLVSAHRGKGGEADRRLREAEQSLEAQADEAKVQWRPFKSTTEIARKLIRKEAGREFAPPPQPPRGSVIPAAVLPPSGVGSDTTQRRLPPRGLGLATATTSGTEAYRPVIRAWLPNSLRAAA